MIAASSASSVVNAEAVALRRQVNPPREPESRLWFSDREIGERHEGTSLEYSTADFRSELSRVERAYYGASFTGVAVAIAIAVSTILFILR